MRKRFFFIMLAFVSTVVNAQMSGVYTISSNSSQNPDYTSFSAAVNALSAGVSGQVIFQVAPGVYEEYVSLNEVSGASSSNRIVFRGMGSDNQQVVLTSNAGYTENSTLTFNGADFISFENMTLQSTSANKAVVVRLREGVENDIFRNVRFVGAVSNTTLDNDKNLVYRISGEWQDIDNEFIDCEFVNGYIALYYQGYNIYQYNDGLLVENCTFTNQSFKSVYVTFTDHVMLNGNTINNTHDVITNYRAVDLFNCRYDCVFENNVINVTRNNNYAMLFTIRPCVGTASEPIIVRNNFMTFNCNTSSCYCYDFSGNANEYIYFAHNTVRCYGTGDCGNVFLEGNGTNIHFYNNLFVNEGAGYVFRFQKTYENRFSDYNRFFSTSAKFGRIGTNDYNSLNDWITTGFDANSVLCSPQFTGGNDLHLTNADGITVANPLTYVTTDIDDQPRSASMPCAGADEYTSGVNLPPMVQNPIQNVVFETYPANQTINLSNTFTDPDDPDENIVITIANNSNPTLVSAVLNNRNLTLQRLLNAAGITTITLNAESNGQSVQTTFSVECVVEDQPPVVINPLSPIHFTDYPQTLSFDLSNAFDDPDNNNLMIDITIQSCPSEITATIDDDDVLFVNRTTANAFNNKTLIIRATSNGKHVDMNVSVSGDEVNVTVDVADFEDVALSPFGIWTPQEGYNEMLSGGWSFTNYYSSYFWGGFTASNHTDLTQTGIDAQYTAAAGCGHDGSAQYAVAYTYGAQTEVAAADGSAQIITGCYVTNNLWAYQNMLEGDYTATPFGGTNGTDPDYFVIHATGQNANGQKIGTVDFYLADYRFENPEDDYILDTWEWFDLTPLGSVTSIYFSLESSKVNSGGMVTPAYFCMDDFNGTAPTQEDLPPYIVNPVEDVEFYMFPEMIEVNLAGIATDDDNDDELISYTLVSNSNEESLSAVIEDNVLFLNRLTADESTANIMLRATSNGLSVDFGVHVVMYEVESVDEHSQMLSVYPNPTAGNLTVKMSHVISFNYKVYNVLGQVVMSKDNVVYEVSLDLSGLEKGIYFLSVTSGKQMTVNKVLVR